VNHIEDEPEEAHHVQETETIDEEHAIVLLAEQGDEDAQLIKDFEDQLIEVCQDNQDLAMCYRGPGKDQGQDSTQGILAIEHEGPWQGWKEGDQVRLWSDASQEADLGGKNRLIKLQKARCQGALEMGVSTKGL
jgi:hypothetical protein